MSLAFLKRSFQKPYKMMHSFTATWSYSESKIYVLCLEYCLLPLITIKHSFSIICGMRLGQIDSFIARNFNTQIICLQVDADRKTRCGNKIIE